MGVRTLLTQLRNRIEGKTFEIWEEANGNVQAYVNGGAVVAAKTNPLTGVIELSAGGEQISAGGVTAKPYVSMGAATPAFTPTSVGLTAAGQQVVIEVIADGSHTPDFSAFQQASGSSAWVNTANTLNVVQFMQVANGYYYSVFQATPPQTVHSAAPTFTAAINSGTPTTIALTVSTALYTDAAHTPAASAFTVGGTIGSAVTITGVTMTSSTTVELTASRAFTAGDTAPTLSYTQPTSGKLTDATLLNPLVATGSVAVTNPLALNYQRIFANGTKLVESGNGSTGWTYTSGAASALTDSWSMLNAAGSADVSIAGVADGWVSIDLPSGAYGSGKDVLLSMSNSAPTSHNCGTYTGANQAFEIYMAASTSTYYYFTNGSGMTNSTVAMQANDRVRLRIDRTAVTAVAEVQRNATGAWTTIHSWALGANASAQLWPCLIASGNGAVITNPLSSGLA